MFFEIWLDIVIRVKPNIHSAPLESQCPKMEHEFVGDGHPCISSYGNKTLVYDKGVNKINLSIFSKIKICGIDPPSAFFQVNITAENRVIFSAGYYLNLINRIAVFLVGTFK